MLARPSGRDTNNMPSDSAPRGQPTSFVGVNLTARGYGCRADPQCSPPYFATTDERGIHEKATHPEWVIAPLAFEYDRWGRAYNVKKK